MIPAEQITGLILAGGRSTRMGGIDKGLQNLHGYPMVMHVLLRLAPQVGHILISANRNIDAYQGLGHTVVTDLIPEVGPLGGIHAGLTQCTSDYLLVTPCDVPLLPANLGEQLGIALQEQQADLAVVTTGAWLQPLTCLMRTCVVSQIADYLDKGGRRADGWYGDLRVARVPFDGQSDAFANINSIDDLQALER